MRCEVPPDAGGAAADAWGGPGAGPGRTSPRDGRHGPQGQTPSVARRLPGSCRLCSSDHLEGEKTSVCNVFTVPNIDSGKVVLEERLIAHMQGRF